jgi:hypothetical protein
MPPLKKITPGQVPKRISTKPTAFEKSVLGKMVKELKNVPADSLKPWPITRTNLTLE